jgi:3D (Asp-Asp-Asp) domain-containing protein
VPAAPRPPAAATTTSPRVSEQTAFTATAYCHDGKTASGAHTNRGVVAADPGVLPLGSEIRVSGLKRGNGVYRVLDTGDRVRGRRIDVFMESCAEAKRFGKQQIRVSVIR